MEDRAVERRALVDLSQLVNVHPLASGSVQLISDAEYIGGFKTGPANDK